MISFFPLPLYRVCGSCFVKGPNRTHIPYINAYILNIHLLLMLFFFSGQKRARNITFLGCACIVLVVLYIYMVDVPMAGPTVRQCICVVIQHSVSYICVACMCILFCRRKRPGMDRRTQAHANPEFLCISQSVSHPYPFYYDVSCRWLRNISR